MWGGWGGGGGGKGGINSEVTHSTYKCLNMSRPQTQSHYVYTPKKVSHTSRYLRMTRSQVPAMQIERWLSQVGIE